MTDWLSITCDVVADTDADAMVVASSLPHATVVHTEGRAEAIDEALAREGLCSERIDATRTRVYGLRSSSKKA